LRDAFELIFGNATNAVIARDPSGRIIFANAAAARMLGRGSTAELIGIPVEGLWQRDPCRSPGSQDQWIHFRDSSNQLCTALLRTTNVSDESGELRFAILTLEEPDEPRTRATDRLAMLTSALAEPLTPRRIAEVVVALGPAALGASAAEIALVEDEATAEVLTSVDDRWRQVPLDAATPIVEVLRAGDMTIREGKDAASGEAFASVLLAVHGKALGALRLTFREARPLGEADHATLLALGQQCAHALERARLQGMESQARAEAASARAQLEAKHKLLKEVVRQLPAGVVCAEVPSGKVLVVNEQTFRIWNTTWVPPTTSADFPTFNGLFTEKHADPERWPLIRTMKHGETVTGEEMEILRDDGSTAFIRVNSAPVRDRAGNIIAAVTTYYDVTDEKRRETERQRLLEQLAVLAEASAGLSASLNYEATLESLGRLAVPRFADCCAVTMRDSEGAAEAVVMLAHVDPERERAIGVELAGAALATHKQRASSLLLAEVAEAHLDDVSMKLADLLRKAGAKSAIIVPLSIRGEILGEVVFLVTGRCYDRVDQETAEEVVRRFAAGVDNARLYRAAQDANRMKDEFLATLSHELRTPLTGIFAWGALLSKGELDAGKRAQAADAIMRSARSQARLIDDLLDVSRIVAGKLEVSLRPIEMQPVVNAAVEALQMASVAKGIGLETALNCSEGRILGDPERLKQIAWNLLSNAIKFTPRGGRVRVQLDQDDGRARLSVSDTGSGISPTFLPHVFDRFRQADSSSTRAHGGLGLGLAIVRHLVDLHGGTVRAESPGIDAGATFTVLLPLLMTDAPENCAPVNGTAPTSSIDPAALRGLSVLVVDDQVDALRALTLGLEHYGAKVVSAASVGEALRVLEWARPDVLVSDIAMPGEDGYALIRALRAGSVEHAMRTPAIALTAYASAEDRLRTREAGYQSHLAKPIQPVELAAAILALAEGRAAR
jgi:signal transduction histidine kinase/PAS domain-containing protein/ActR/RegA family two-component response regulator